MASMRVLIRWQFYHNALKNKIKLCFILNQSCLLIFCVGFSCPQLKGASRVKKLGIMFSKSCNLLSSLLISELVDKCIGSRIHIVMKTDKEIVGTLLGFDDFVSILCKEQWRRFVFAQSVSSVSVDWGFLLFALPWKPLFLSRPCVTHTSYWNVCFFAMFQFLVVFGFHYVWSPCSPDGCPWLSLLDMVLEDVTELYVHFYLSIYFCYWFLLFVLFFNKWIVIAMQVHASNFPSVLQWDHTRGEEDNQTGPDPPQWQQHHHGLWRICFGFFCCCFFHELDCGWVLVFLIIVNLFLFAAHPWRRRSWSLRWFTA